MFSILTIIAIFFLITLKIYEKNLLKHFTYHCYFSESEVNEGDDIEFIEEVENNNFLPIPWLKSELTTSKWLEFSEQQSAVTESIRFVASFFSIKSYSRIKRVWKVKCLKRGHYSISDIVIVASDILGFIKLSDSVDVSSLNNISVRVLPLLSDYDESNMMISNSIGEAFTFNKLIADPFFSNGVREYTPVDRYQSINWYATAKQQQLMVNKNDFTTESSVTIILNIQSTPQDISHAIYEQSVEKCISTCATAIYTLFESNSNNIRLISNTQINGCQIDVRSSDYSELLRVLADIDLNISVPFPHLITAILPEIKNSEILIISSYQSEFLNQIEYENPLVRLLIPDLSGGVKI